MVFPSQEEQIEKFEKDHVAQHYFEVLRTLISKYRPNADILALTFDELTERGLMLNWGVIPMLTDAPSSTDDMFEIAERKAVEAGLVQSGDDIVIVAGVPLGEAVRTNTMRIRTVR